MSALSLGCGWSHRRQITGHGNGTWISVGNIPWKTTFSDVPLLPEMRCWNYPNSQCFVYKPGFPGTFCNQNWMNDRKWATDSGIENELKWATTVTEEKIVIGQFHNFDAVNSVSITTLRFCAVSSAPIKTALLGEHKIFRCHAAPWKRQLQSLQSNFKTSRD